MKTLLLSAALLLSTSVFAAPATYDEATQIAQTQFAAQDFAGAQQSLEAAFDLARTNEDKVEALTQLGALFEEQGRYAESLQTYQRVLPLVANSPDELNRTRLFIAQNYVNQKQWQNAAAGWAQLVESAASPQTKVSFRLELARAYAELKQTGEAQQQLALVRAQMMPFIADAKAGADARGFAHLTIGRSYAQEDNFDAARQSFEAALAIADLSPEFRVNTLKSLAEVAAKQGREEDAKTAFTKARQLVIKAASLHFASKGWAEAAELYREAAQIGTPDAFTALALNWQLALSLHSQNDIDGARAEFQRIIAIAPDASSADQTASLKLSTPVAYQYLAQGYIAQGQFDLARATLNSLLALPDLQAPIRQKAEEMLRGLPNVVTVG